MIFRKRRIKRLRALKFKRQDEPYPFDDEHMTEVSFQGYCHFIVYEGGYTEYGSYLHYLDDAENPYDPTEAHYSFETVAKHINYKLKKSDYTSFFNNFKREVKPFVKYESDGDYWVIKDWQGDKYLDGVADAIYYTLKDKVPKDEKFYIS